jgi:hypothetical protein
MLYWEEKGRMYRVATVKAFALLTSRSEGAVYRMLREGMPGLRLGKGLVFVLTDDATEWMRSRSQIKMPDNMVENFINQPGK